AGIDILIANDVVLAEVTSGLYFDQRERNFSRSFHAMDSTEGDVNGVGRCHQLNLGIDGHFGGAFYDDPVFGAVVVALKRQSRAWMDNYALHLETGTDDEAFVPAPGAVVAGKRLCLRG